ncbi:MAG: GyrI-like domain-containing protein [Pseudomonadota bacterium]
MDTKTKPELAPPRIEEKPALLLAGLGGPFNTADAAAIPAMWQRFAPYIGHIPGQSGFDAYGVVQGDKEGMEYYCAVAVDNVANCPPELRQLAVPAHRYAVFRHSGHVSTIRDTWVAIMDHWLPNSGYHAAEAPFIEHYGADFNPHTGNGGVGLWVPI